MDPNQGGLLGLFSRMRKPDEETGLNFMNKLGMAASVLNPMNPQSANYRTEMLARGQRRLKGQARNRTISELQKRADAGDAIAARYLSAVQSGAIDESQAFGGYLSETAAIDLERRKSAALGVKDPVTRASQKFLNGTVYTITDRGVVVYDPSGKLVTGADAERVLKEANEFENQNRAIGVGLSEAAKLQQKDANEAFNKAELVTGQIRTIDRAISQIDAGAQTGLVYNILPDITAEAGGLRAALQQMGLDVVSSVTFGALSQSELDIAMSTAYPQNASSAELRKFLVDRKNSLSKLRRFTEETAMFLRNPLNTKSDWTKLQQQTRDLKASGASENPYMGMSLEDLNKIYLQYNALTDAQKAQFVKALEAAQG
jgi:hypothetical protein